MNKFLALGLWNLNLQAIWSISSYNFCFKTDCGRCWGPVNLLVLVKLLVTNGTECPRKLLPRHAALMILKALMARSLH